MKTIIENKKFIIIIKLVLCVLTFIAGAGAYFTGLLSENSAPALKGVFVLTLFLFIFYTIFNSERVWKSFKDKKNAYTILYAVCGAFFVLSLFNPLMPELITVTEFKRIIGQGVINDYDCQKVIRNFNICFVAFGALTGILCLGVNYLKNTRTSEANMQVWKYLDNVIVICAINCILKAIMFFKNGETENTGGFCSSYMLFIIVASGFVYLLTEMDKKISPQNYIKYITALFGLSVAFALTVPEVWARSDGRLCIAIWAVLIALMIAAVFLGLAGGKDKHENLMNCFIIMLCAIPLVTSLYIEAVNVLNQYSIFVAAVRDTYLITTVVVIAIGTAIIYFASRLRKTDTIDWKNVGYILLILGIVSFTVQLDLVNLQPNHDYELANSSVLINDFLRYGKIPVVEHYGGHMLSRFMGGVTYGIINNDFAGAIYSPYSIYHEVFGAVLLYLLVKRLWNKDMALYTVLFIPFNGNLRWETISFGMLICFAAMSFVKKNTYPRAILIWLASGLCILDRLDLGYAFTLGAVIALAIYCIADKNKRAALKLLVTLAIVGVIGVASWFAICMLKDISPLTRLREFIEISASNLNWAYYGIGHTELSVFSWAYILIPATVEILLLYIVFSTGFRKRINNVEWVLLLIIGFSIFINFPRGIVRHSLMENTTRFAVWASYIFISAFICFCKNKDGRWFAIPLVALIIMNSVLLSNNNVNDESVTDSAMVHTGEVVRKWTAEYDGDDTYYESIKKDNKAADRMQPDIKLRNSLKTYSEILDAAVGEGETFVDYINVSNLYADMDIESPVYVSQSPLQLSGDFSQEEFIKQLEAAKDKIAIVFMPLSRITLDGLVTNYRYYKVSEYLYQNYVPVCANNNPKYAVWTSEDRYEDIKSRLENSVAAKRLVFDFDAADYPETSYESSLEFLPYIWANKDKEKSAENTVVATSDMIDKENGMLRLSKSSGEIDKTKGNYALLTIPGFVAGNRSYNYVVMRFGILDENGEFTEKYSYRFRLKYGEEKYIVRASSEYSWYSDEINAVKIESDIRLKEYDAKVDILEGD